MGSEWVIVERLHCSLKKATLNVRGWWRHLERVRVRIGLSNGPDPKKLRPKSPEPITIISILAHNISNSERLIWLSFLDEQVTQNTQSCHGFLQYSRKLRFSVQERKMKPTIISSGHESHSKSNFGIVVDDAFSVDLTRDGDKWVWPPPVLDQSTGLA